MILCSELKNGLCKIVTKSQVVTKFNVTKSRLHCIPLSSAVGTLQLWAYYGTLMHFLGPLCSSWRVLVSLTAQKRLRSSIILVTSILGATR